MSWNVKCRRVRKVLALWAGNDVELHEQVSAERHMAMCPGCREHWTMLQTGQQVLEQARLIPAGSTEPVRSVWPEVQRQIRTLQAEPESPAWHGWLPMGALAAACLAVILTTSPMFSPGAGNMAGRSNVIYETQPVGQPAPGAPIRPRPVRPAPAPQDTPVRTLLDGTDVRDL